MKKFLLIPVLVLMVSCSSLNSSKNNYTEKYKLNDDDMKDWPSTITLVVEKESLIEDWYGSEDPINYLRKTGKMNEKEYNFLTSLEKKETLSVEDKAEFQNILAKYVKSLDRTFKLKDENIKDPSGLVKKIMSEAVSVRISNPSKHIMEQVATTKERNQIVDWSKQDSLSDKDIKNLRKLLNKFIARGEFYDATSWQNREMSNRAEEILDITKASSLSKDEKNNVNAKALYIAYSDYLSELEKWK